MAKNILVVGMNPVWQRIIFLRNLELGKVNRAYDVVHVASGKGLNYSKVLKNLGATPILAGFAGGDRGVKFIKGANKLGIESVCIQTESVTRSCTTLISENPHNVTEIIDPSPLISQKEAYSLLDKIKETAEECGALVICGTHPNGVSGEIYKEIFKCFEDKLTVVDAFMDIQVILESKPRIIKVNQFELTSITKEEDVIRAAAVCFDKYGIEYLGVTNGASEAYFFTPQSRYVFRMPEVAVRNSTGAGDAVGAGMLFKNFYQQEDMHDAFRFGLSCGVASCETDMPSEFLAERAHELMKKIEWSESRWRN